MSVSPISIDRSHPGDVYMLYPLDPLSPIPIHSPFFLPFGFRYLSLFSGSAHVLFFIFPCLLPTHPPFSLSLFTSLCLLNNRESQASSRSSPHTLLPSLPTLLTPFIHTYLGSTLSTLNLVNSNPPPTHTHCMNFLLS